MSFRRVHHEQIPLSEHIMTILLVGGCKYAMPVVNDCGEVKWSWGVFEKPRSAPPPHHLQQTLDRVNTITA